MAAHTFLFLEWNLISQAEYVVDSNIYLVSFQEDALLFDIGKKTDQEGTKHIDHPWHVYSNPEYPEMYPFLAMACHLICDPTILNVQCHLFEGSEQYERFNIIFLEIVGHPKYRQRFIALGMPSEDFGTHSIRKGAVTFVATECTACPPIASIYLRVNLAMPGVMNRYIKYESAGDQFTVKCVSGSSRMSTEFAIIPVYFDFTSFGEAEMEHNESRIDNWIKARMPLTSQSNEKVFGVFRMCVAALVYYDNFLKEHLHPMEYSLR